MKKASKRDTWKETNYTDPGKTFTQKLHCIRRIRERLGIVLSEQDYEHIVACIKNEKKSTQFAYTYVRSQTSRLDIYEIVFEGKVPVNIIYDKHRKTIVTILFQSDDMSIDFYYDVFNNKVNLKHDLGFNKGWCLDGENLMIPSEIVEKKEDYWEVVSDGILKEKRFKFDNNSLVEVM